MSKKLTLSLITILAVALIFAPAMAKKIPGEKGRTAKAGKSHVYQVQLVAKDPGTWEVDPEGAWGKVTLNVKKGKIDFIFNGHGLISGESYTLIYYPDPWPGLGLVCFGTGMVDGDGNLHLQGSVDYFEAEGAKIWLVLTDDVDCNVQKMIGWHPEDYLFEFNSIDL